MAKKKTIHWKRDQQVAPNMVSCYCGIRDSMMNLYTTKEYDVTCQTCLKRQPIIDKEKKRKELEIRKRPISIAQENYMYLNQERA